MATKPHKERIEAKRAAVVARFEEVSSQIDYLARIWDERTLDTLILAFGIGRVELGQ